MAFATLLLSFGLRDAFSGAFASEEQMQFILAVLEKL